MMNIATLLAVGSGGFIGASLRYLINNYISHNYPHTLPYGILFVNLFGSLLMGIMFGIFIFTTFFSQDARIYSFITTGMLGALTTYSTFAMESFILLHSGHYGLAALNMLLNLFGTILFAAIGYLGIKFIFSYFSF